MKDDVVVVIDNSIINSSSDNSMLRPYRQKQRPDDADESNTMLREGFVLATEEATIAMIPMIIERWQFDITTMTMMMKL